jgi:hypothetical protein
VIGLRGRRISDCTVTNLKGIGGSSSSCFSVWIEAVGMKICTDKVSENALEMLMDHKEWLKSSSGM